MTRRKTRSIVATTMAIAQAVKVDLMSTDVILFIEIFKKSYIDHHGNDHSSNVETIA